jgi:uncharacterized delta-60 repeat protein
MKKLLLLIIFISLNVFSQNINLDSSFGTNGISVLDRINTVGSTMELQTDGKILVSGFIESTTTTFIARLNTDGTLDTSFGNNGYFEISGESLFLDPINILSDNKVLVGLNSPDKIIKLNSNGALDTSFGTNGETDLSSLTSDFRSILVESDNSILAIGFNHIIKLLPNGTIDTSYGTNGKLVTPISNSIYSEDNNILSIISAGTGGSGMYKLIKKDANGNLITTFGTNGEVDITDLDNEDSGFGLFIDNNGKIIVIASRETQLRVTRYLANGQIDSSFAQNGNLIDNNNPPRLLDFKSNGNKLLFSGVTNTTQSPLNLYISQYNEDGTIDTSFNTNGIFIENTNTAEEFSDNIYLLNNGKIIVSGAYFNESEKYFVARYSTSTLSVNEIDEKIEIVFQNPLENELNLYSQKIRTGITLIDLNGSIVKNFRGNSMDTSFISSGMYFIKILLDDGRIVTRKVIKK